MSDNAQPAYARPDWLITVLGISPTIDIGICRFAYALVLPAVRESFDRSSSMAGLIATGAITDAFRRLSYALKLVAGVVPCVIRTITRREGTPRTEPLGHGRST